MKKRENGPAQPQQGKHRWPPTTKDAAPPPKREKTGQEEKKRPGGRFQSGGNEKKKRRPDLKKKKTWCQGGTDSKGKKATNVCREENCVGASEKKRTRSSLGVPKKRGMTRGLRHEVGSLSKKGFLQGIREKKKRHTLRQGEGGA